MLDHDINFIAIKSTFKDCGMPLNNEELGELSEIIDAFTRENNRSINAMLEISCRFCEKVLDVNIRNKLKQLIPDNLEEESKKWHLINNNTRYLTTAIQEIAPVLMQKR